MNNATLNPEKPRANLTSVPTPPPPAADLPAGRVDLTSRPAAAAVTPNRGPGFKRIALGALAVVAVIGVVVFAREWWTVGRFIESTDDAYVGGDVTVIAPKVAGFVAQLAVGDNQRVKVGDLLVKLDDRDYRAALAKTEAAVAMQRATLTNLDATLHLQEAMVGQAEAEITAADAETVRTHDDQGRFQHLVKSGAVSAEGLENAETLYKQALASGQKAAAALQAAQRELEVIGTQKLQTQAALAQANADRDMAQLNLGYTELRAPIEGTVGNRSAQTGAYATIGSQLISLVPAQGLWIDANFKESQLKLVRPGAPATIEVDSLPGQVFHGHVMSIAPATGAQFSVLPPENATGNFTKIVQRVAVRIVLDDEGATLGQLRPGLSVTAKVNGKAGS